MGECGAGHPEEEFIPGSAQGECTEGGRARVPSLRAFGCPNRRSGAIGPGPPQKRKPVHGRPEAPFPSRSRERE